MPPVYYAHDLYPEGEPMHSPPFSEGIEKVNDYAFCNCDKITWNFTIPSSVTT